MISADLNYGAVAGKVRAMYGKRLKSEDYAQLSKLHSVSDIAAFLSRHPAWSRCLEGVDTRIIDNTELENLLRFQQLDDYMRILKFVRDSDKRFLSFPVLKAELEYILAALRFLGSPNSFPMSLALPEPIIKHSSVDFQALISCGSIQDLLEAISSSIYYEPLLRFSHAAPERFHDYYTAVETLLQNVYYLTLRERIDSSYKGPTRGFVFSTLGREVDVMNIIHLLRLKKLFPHQDAAALFYPLPVSWKLSSEAVKSFIAAPDYESAFAVIMGTPYRRLFSREISAGLEEFYYRMLYEYNSKQIRRLSPYLPVAYMNLKKIEFINLTNLIECARYGVDFVSSPVTLIGA